MDKNNIIGITLIFILLFIYLKINAPSQAQIEAQKRAKDSLEQIKLQQDSLGQLRQEGTSTAATTQTQPVLEQNDSLRQVALGGQFGAFAPSASGTAKDVVLENDVFKIVFTSKGGRIKEVEMKKFSKLIEDKDRNDTLVVLKLMEDIKNKFEYFIPLNGVGTISTEDLYFDANQNGNTVSFKANAGAGRYFEQSYTIKEDSYNIDYDVKLVGLNNLISKDVENIKLNWVNYLDRIEKNTSYEGQYSCLYYKQVEDSPTYCSCSSDDKADGDNEAIEWISHSHQFFNSSLIAKSKDGFTSAINENKMLGEKDKDLKLLRSEVMLPFGQSANESIAMNFYVGPNKFERLAAFDNDLEDVIPFGWSIFGTVNRWIIRPLFGILSGFIGSAGLVILMLTLLVKVALYPLTYKMLYSQSKMAALKPQIEKLKEKIGDDPQKLQMENMKMYREYGVNPLGGCMPMLLQMPIWFALYRFFPASIEFRQASFLWANDLSSYDVFFKLPFELPLGMGAHLSMFTILWAVTTLIYTFYNTKHMDMSANPAMKYMQYAMPVMFMGFFNSFAAGLTCYLFFSNSMNIIQNIVTKEYIIDKGKIEKEMEEHKKKPKKKGGFQERLQNALEEQKKIQAQREAQGRKNPKKKKK